MICIELVIELHRMLILGILHTEFGMKIGRARYDEKYEDDRET